MSRLTDAHETLEDAEEAVEQCGITDLELGIPGAIEKLPIYCLEKAGQYEEQEEYNLINQFMKDEMGMDNYKSNLPNKLQLAVEFTTEDRVIANTQYLKGMIDEKRYQEKLDTANEHEMNMIFKMRALALMKVREITKDINDHGDLPTFDFKVSEYNKQLAHIIEQTKERVASNNKVQSTQNQGR